MVAKSISHHFETLVEIIACIYRGIIRDSSVWQDFVHPQIPFAEMAY